MKQFYILGDIIDTEIEKTSQEDVCPKDFKNFLETLENGEDIEIHINSCGGSVSGGLSIANLITHYKGRTTAIVDGIAASIASVIACAADTLKMGKTSYLMIHRVFGTVCGNSEDLRKEAATMEKMTKSLITFYKRKFDLTDEEIEKYLAEETWISGQEANEYKLNAVIEDEIRDIKLAAKLIQKIKNNFTNKDIIERFNIMEKPEEKIEETKTVEEVKETVENPVVEEVKEEVKEEIKEEVKEGEEMTTEEVKEEVKEAVEEIKEEKEEEKLEEIVKRLTEENEILKKKLDECTKKLNECKPEEDVEKRVSGMQSKMQNKINDLTINFKNEIEKKEKELSEYKNQVSSLIQKLEKTEMEFSEMKSAYQNKETALANLNASVLTPKAEEKEIDFSKNPREYLNWIDAKRRSM